MTHLSVNPPDHKAAEQAYLKSIEVEPNDWRAYHQLGMIYLVDNVPDKAAKFLDRAEQLMPDFVRNGRVKFLEKEASDLQERTPQSEADGVWDMAHGPEYLLARNYEDHAAWDQAITGYKADLQKYPDDAAAYFGLGNCYVGKNDFNAAVESYNSAIKLKPKYAAAYLNMGLALGQLHRDKEAMDALQTARRLDPMVLRHVPGLLKAVAEQMRDAKK
jgi:tetratricopeptide (TPR) repeat protein